MTAVHRALAGILLRTPIDTLLGDLDVLGWPYTPARIDVPDQRIVVKPRLGARRLEIRMERALVVAITADYALTATGLARAASDLPWRRDLPDGAYFASADTLVHVSRDEHSIVLLDACRLRSRAAIEAVYRALFDQVPLHAPLPSA